MILAETQTEHTDPMKLARDPNPVIMGSYYLQSTVSVICNPFVSLFKLKSHIYHYFYVIKKTLLFLCTQTPNILNPFILSLFQPHGNSSSIMP